ncbi:hypothetical protein N7468_004353 [Penicillium chermesinum]|uniref:Uncharacterized protein n=1 Tax=Penicillium chermesinum TaxID=63820 RepID=A0A9W9P857_9EURO|nr:uncharacterized protein N7468_004353 [Penicillium chermesinum]KAJ5239734.1 hypothetical protein N7468_004353 [Penicillium chermesinum]
MKVGLFMFNLFFTFLGCLSLSFNNDPSRAHILTRPAVSEICGGLGVSFMNVGSGIGYVGRSEPSVEPQCFSCHDGVVTRGFGPNEEERWILVKDLDRGSQSNSVYFRDTAAE